MDEHLRENLLSCETIYDGKIVHLEKWRAKLPNGREVSREIIRHVGASAIVAVNERRECVMVRQYRAPLDTVTLELPAGKLNAKQDDPLECAKRELSEETGVKAASWRHLTCINTTVGFCDEKIDIYLATGLTQGGVHPDDDEFVEVIWIDFDDLYARALAGELNDCKTAIGIMLAKQHLK